MISAIKALEGVHLRAVCGVWCVCLCVCLWRENEEAKTVDFEEEKQEIEKNLQKMKDYDCWEN